MEHNKTKQRLGQYMTTNCSYILQNLSIPNGIINIIEPFCGNGDLLTITNSNHVVECFDIDPKKDFIQQQDTIKNPPDYKKKFVLTNPPYLARNKCKDKELFEKYKTNDLYKCFIKELLKNSPVGGIIIIPLNFWSSIRKQDIILRKSFLKKFIISNLNIFEEKVFEDTSYTICAFQFELKCSTVINNIIPITIYPSNITISVELNDNNNFQIGGEIYYLPIKNEYQITRITKKNKNNKNKTNILVKCIDDNRDNQIQLSFVKNEDIYIDETENQSSRTYASLIIEPFINKKKQQQLVKAFNTYLTLQRKKYHSLFLTNYRESKDIARKRISFDLVYKIIQYLLEHDFQTPDV